jgi:hypothetical protein
MLNKPLPMRYRKRQYEMDAGKPADYCLMVKLKLRV